METRNNSFFQKLFATFLANINVKYLFDESQILQKLSYTNRFTCTDDVKTSQRHNKMKCIRQTAYHAVRLTGQRQERLFQWSSDVCRSGSSLKVRGRELGKLEL